MYIKIANLNSLTDADRLVNLLNKCGIYVTEINMAEKESIMQTFAMQNVILNVKAELDQLVEGLRALNVHNTICSHAALFQETFTLNTKEPSAGMYIKKDIIVTLSIIILM